MKTVRENLVPILKAEFEKCIRNFESLNSDNSLSDIYLQLDEDNASLLIYDDVENKLGELNLEKELESDPDHFPVQLKNTLQFVLGQLDQDHFFEKDFIFKPFAVSFVDDHFIVTEELLFLDDNTLKLDGNLLTNLDKELDDFLRNLMK